MRLLNHIIPAMLLCCGCIIYAAGVRAQSKGYTLKNIGSLEGLPSSEIYSLAQDHKGFIWIGTSAGLSRYDGNRFENFQLLPEGPVGTVYNIRENRDGTLWVCSENGLFFYSRFHLSKVKLLQENSTQPFYTTAESPEGDLLAGNSTGLYRIPQKTIAALMNGQAVTLQNFHFKPLSLQLTGENRAVRQLSINKSQQVLAGSLYKVALIDGESVRLLKTEGSTNDWITEVHINDDGLCMWGTALVGFSATGNGKSVQLDETNTPSFYATYGLGYSNGTYTLCTAAGLFRLDTVTLKASPLLSYYYENPKWITCMLADRDNNYWVGTHEGIYFFRKNPFHVYAGDGYYKVNEIFSLYETREGELLAGGNRGRLHTIGPDSATSRFPPSVTAFPRAEIFSVLETPEKALWLGSGYQGLAYYANGVLQNFKQEDGLCDNTIQQLFYDSRKQLWALGDNGFTKINKGPAPSFEAFRFPGTDTLEIKGKKAFESPTGQLWAATRQGLFRIKGTQTEQVQLSTALPANLSLNGAFQMNRDTVWLCSNDYGLLLTAFDASGNLKLVKSYSTTEGLRSNTVVDAVTDLQGRIWFAGYSGISCLLDDRGKPLRIVHFNEKNGFQLHNYASISLLRDHAGQIWCGTSTGTVSFEPEQLLSGLHPQQLFITSLYFPGTDSTLLLYHSSLDKGQQPMVFPFRMNSFSVQFTLPEYADPAGIQFAYRLKGKDSSWTAIGNSHAISFPKLGAGTYTLEIKAQLNGLLYDPATAYTFTILPPFWQRQWFILLVTILLLLFLIAGIRYREKRIRNQEAEKTAQYRHQLEIEQVIHYFASSINEKEDTDSLLWDVARNCIARLELEDCVIYLLNDTGNRLIQKAAWGPKTTEENKIVNPLEIETGKGIVGTVAATGKAEIVNDTSIDSRYIVDDAPRGSEIAVPILQNGKTIGVIDSENSRKGYYTARHLQVLSTIAGLMADKMDKLAALRQTREKELELVTLNQDLAQSQLTALRAQMNPHFIFNAMNSIQQFILKGDVDQANHYLSRFSRLQREILQNSDQQWIPLEKEIMILQFYLELEQLRFGSNFEYRFQVSPEIDPAELRIPPMILQPFIENAIWHGLMPKETDRRLWVAFTLLGENTLEITISDNGIGRKAAAANKEKAGASRHVSRGMQLVYDRLELLKKQFHKPFAVEIRDNYAENGKATGTTVQLRFYSAS